MLNLLLLVSITAAAIGSGLVAGIFYAFSSFVMAGFARLPAEQGAAAMNAINVAVLTPSFMVAFLGTALVSLGLGAFGLLSFGETGGKLLLAASLIYLVGSLGVTLGFNVPLNDRLAAATPATLPAVWATYLDVWTLWNRVRTGASLVSAMLFVAALMTR